MNASTLPTASRNHLIAIGIAGALAASLMGSAQAAPNRPPHTVETAKPADLVNRPACRLDISRDDGLACDFTGGL